LDSTELKERIKNLSIWKRGEERAPHKPLLKIEELKGDREFETTIY
jgi:predicted restriction endonuclease